MHGGKEQKATGGRDAAGLKLGRKVFSFRYARHAALVLSLALLGAMLSNVLASASGSSSLVQQGAKLTGGVEESGEGRFGHGVALSGDGATALVGAPDDDGDRGAVWVYVRSEASWTQLGPKLTGGEAEIGEGHFGGSVALSADGNTALVGAPRDNGGRGAVWVFTRSGSEWTRQAELTGGAAESEAGWFGESVALSSDGNTALMSAPVDHNDTGAVWVFTRSGSVWTRQARLAGGAEESGGGWFGGSVALSAEGDTALIGDPADAGKVGAVWVFARSGSTWTQQGVKLTGAGESGEGRFGGSVALAGDGDTAMIGGRSDGGGSGAVWVFARSGSTWTQQGSKLTGGEEAGGEGAGGEGAGGGEEVSEEERGQGRFGGSVALSADGDTALVGTRNDSNGRGAVWVFARAGSTWTRQDTKLTGAEEQGKGQFGYSLALSADAGSAVVGGVADGHKAGAAWVFAQPSSGEPPSTEPPPTTTSGQSSSTTSSPNTTPSSTTPVPKLGVQSFKATGGYVQLVSATIPVRHGRRARIELRCVSAVACRGMLKLTIVARATMARSGKSGKRSRTIRLGAVSFALRAGETADVRLTLGAAGRARLRVAHGRMVARLTIAASTPRSRTQIHAVRLVRWQAARASSSSRPPAHGHGRSARHAAA